MKEKRRRYNRINEVMFAKGITANWLAEQIGVVYQTVSYWRSNQRQPRIKYLFKIAELLDVSPRDLLRENA